jgi:DNA-directed RNA polymerase subunit M/transcription elongation factor TFIIS
MYLKNIKNFDTFLDFVKENYKYFIGFYDEYVYNQRVNKNNCNLCGDYSEFLDKKNTESFCILYYKCNNCNHFWKFVEDIEIENIQKDTERLLKCGKCKSNNTSYTQMQTRSADEPMTTFAHCKDCGNRWKFC